MGVSKDLRNIPVYTSQGNRLNQENLAIVIGKHKKNVDILRFKRVKF